MPKATFNQKLENYIKFFETELKENPLEPPFNNNVDYLKGYANTVLISLKRAYLKEHPMENNFNFIYHVDSMRNNIKQTEFICTDSICKMLLDYLNFLRRHYDV